MLAVSSHSGLLNILTGKYDTLAQPSIEMPMTANIYITNGRLRTDIGCVPRPPLARHVRWHRLQT
jgi:hypothetical protein